MCISVKKLIIHFFSYVHTLTSEIIKFAKKKKSSLKLSIYHMGNQNIGFSNFFFIAQNHIKIITYVYAEISIQNT